MQVDNLKEKLLEKLENLLIDIQLIPEAVKTASPCSHEVSISLSFNSSISQKCLFGIFYLIFCSQRS